MHWSWRVMALLFGFTTRREYFDGQLVRDDNWPGLVPILVLIALLFSGRYPKPLHDQVMGFNRRSTG